MKKMTALLLAVLLCFGTTGTLAFADENATAGQTASSVFKGGYAVTPVATPAVLITAGDILTFTVNPNNFENASTFDLTKLNVFVGMTPDGQLVSQSGKDYLAPQGFWRDAVTGVITFSVKAVAACNQADFSVGVGVIKVVNLGETVEETITMSSVYKFKTQIAAAASSSSSSSSSSSASASSSASSVSSTASSASSSTSSVSSAASSVSSSAPESSSSQLESSDVRAASATESSSSQPESSDTSSVSEPEPSSSEPESSSQSESSNTTSSETSSSSEAVPSSSGDGQNDDNNDGGVLGGLVNFFGGLFAPAAAPAGRVATAGSPANTVDDGINATQVNPSGNAWIPRGGASNSTAPSAINTPIVFEIPVNNFISTGTTATTGTNANTLNTNAIFKVEVMDGTNDLSNHFDRQFVFEGGSYRVRLTPITTVNDPYAIPTTGLLLPKGTTFSFVGATNRFALAADLLVVPANTGSTKADGIDTTGGAELGGNHTWVTRNGVLLPNNISLTDLYDEAKAGDEFLIHFMPSYFTWTGNTPAKVTLSSIRSKISLRSSLGTGGSKVFETIELTSSKGEAVVRIKFKDRIPTIRPIEYKSTIHMLVGGRRTDRLDIEGTISDSDPDEFYSEDTYIYIGDGTIGKAVEPIRKPEIYIGDDIYITMNVLSRNTKFYGTSTCNELDEDDEELVLKYPDIVYVYKLYTVGLNGAGSSVGFDNLGGLYVYDKNFNYLGRSNQKVEYSDVYYLAAKMLDIEEEDEPDPIESIPEEELYPVPNTNDNPSTGR